MGFCSSLFKKCIKISTQKLEICVSFVLDSVTLSLKKLEKALKISTQNLKYMTEIIFKQ